MKLKSHVHFQCIGIYYGDGSNSSGMVEDEPYTATSNQATVLVAVWGKDELPGNRNPNVYSSSRCTPVVHVPGFPAGCDSLLMTKVTQKTPSENRTL